MAASVAVAVDGLAGELGHQLGLGDGVEDAARAPGGPVLGQGSARLAHEPHRDPLDGLAPAGPDERGVVEAAGASGPRRSPGRSASARADRVRPASRLAGTARPMQGRRPRATADEAPARPPIGGVARAGRTAAGAYNRGFPEPEGGRRRWGWRPSLRPSRSSSTWPTRGSTPCGATPTPCSKGCSTWAGAAPSSPGPSGTSIVRTSLARLEQLDIGDQALTFGRIDRVDDGRPRPESGDGNGDGTPDDRDLPHRAPGHPQARPRAAGGRLAGAGGRALLPGHRPRPPGSRAAPPPGPRGTPGGRPRGRALQPPAGSASPTRGRRRPDGTPTATGPGRADPGRPAHRRPGRPAGRPRPGPVRPDDRHRLHHPARAGRDHPGPARPACWSSRAVRAPARRRWPSTGPPTCSTPTGSRSSARACWWSGPTRCSSATSNRSCPRWGRPGVTLSTVSGLVPEIRVSENGPVEVARLKGDARMAKVIARAVRTRQRPLARRRRACPTGRWCCGSRSRTAAHDRRRGPPPARHPQRPPAPGRAGGGPGAGRPGPPDPADPGRRDPGVGDRLPRLRGPGRARPTTSSTSRTSPAR